MKITIVAGARPNFMKIAPIMRAIDNAREQGKEISYRLIYAGQSTDTSLDPSLFSDLNMKEPDAYLEIGFENLTERAGGIMMAFEKELKENPTNIVLVVDDLTSTMACAIVAKKQNIKVAHLVAGTRSFDMSMPKELNRMITDGLSDYLFTAGMGANRNLNQTGTENEQIFLVGNILMDTLRYNRNRFIRPKTFDILGLKENNYILLTINRHALLENKENFKKIIERLISASNGTPIIAPLHNYVREAISELNISAPNLHILPPQPYLSFGYFTSKAKAIVTDSGNVAEEATFLGVPCITLNSYVEHPETCTIGTNELVGEDAEQLGLAIEKVMRGEWKEGGLPERWDGRTADRIVQILLQQA
ncbi:non-hydrolyzing UDP-N-acetylglucosamine 2-epimerase [Bacteroides sedimenti]|uniref:UDP-N-acetyl glucosamine 2-epimerase n=1 Tax=Bacteroides sedimenti TaxID=2136147 RepID=A0ABN6Z6P3_9BACE